MLKYVWLCLALTACTTGLFAAIPEENGTIEVFFCDQVDCSEVFSNRTAGTALSCAFYHAYASLFEGQVALVVDEEHPLPGAVVESGSGLMHNKFCVFGDYVWTGSWNPAQKMTIPNNVVFVQSKTLAKAYKAEFDELAGGVFHGGRSSPGLVRLNGRLVEAYFCPEDDCQGHVIEVLSDAKKSVHFMTFSFTDDDIGALLVNKLNKGVDVRGVFDPRKDSYSEYEKLKGVSAVARLHHKVFIIDGNTVVTGSYNPSRNANERNDENVVVIRDPVVAAQFEAEFSRLYESSS